MDAEAGTTLRRALTSSFNYQLLAVKYVTVSFRLLRRYLPHRNDGYDGRFL
jgi:hypothetical protein